jgi:predicted MFS family arabinose efflux permease
VFVAAIVLLFATLLVMWRGSTNYVVVVGGLLSFFVAFNILEAMLPSLISRIAHPDAKGAALGVYNTTQAFGLFLGGALGGWLVKNYDAGAVFLGGTAMAALWLVAAASMPPVPMRRQAATAQAPHGILEPKS